MVRYKIFIISLFAVVLTVQLLCTQRSPVGLFSPETAYSTITITSSKLQKSESEIVDSVGKTFSLNVIMHGGLFIDSLHLTIYRPQGNQSVLDSLVVIRFGENDIRDTLNFEMNFKKPGLRHFELITYKALGYSCTTSVEALVLGSNTSNSPPVFITDAPKNVYRFAEGDTVRIAVGATDFNNDSLKYSYLLQDRPLPRKETALLAGGFFIWESQPGDSGKYTIVFTVEDEFERTEFKTTLVVGDISYNSSPLITSEPPSTAQTGRFYRYAPTAIDDEGGVLTWKLSGSVPESMELDSSKGIVTWIPSPGVTSSGKLWLIVFDDGEPVAADSQVLQINVTGVNRQPAASSYSTKTDMGVTLDIQLYATDPDSDAVTYTIVNNPPFGSIVPKNDSLLAYTPNASFSGVDTLRYIASDALLSSDTARILIFVAVENQKPVAISSQVVIKEDDPTEIILSASDVEGSPLTYTVLSGPQFGTLTGTTEKRLYTPNVNFNGVDTFTFVVSDGLLESDPAVVFVTITPVNDIPLAHNAGVPVAKNTPVAIQLSVTDPDDSVFVLNIVSKPHHGTVIETAGKLLLEYTPDADYVGNDTITYTVFDESEAQSDIAVVIIAAGGSNHKPVAKNQSVSVPEDSSVTIVLEGSDPEGAPLKKYTVIKRPLYGTFSSSGATLKYRPNNNFYGSDTLQFTVNDGVLDSDPATVVITVLPVNDPPVAPSQSYTTTLTTPLMIELTAMDVDDDVFTYAISAMPKRGRLDTSGIQSGYVRYTPDANSKQNDTIRYVAMDAAGKASGEAVITVFILVTNQRPKAVAQRIDIKEDATTPIFLTGEDETPSQNLHYSVTVPPKHGTFEGYFPNISYKTEPNYNGPDTFWFKVSDGILESEPAWVIVTVLPVNDPPVVASMSKNTVGEKVIIILAATDVDDNKFTYKIVKTPSHGTLGVTNLGKGEVEYTPNKGFKGIDTITYQAFDDETWASNVGTITIAVALENQPPVAIADAVSLREDDSLKITLKGSDLETATEKLTYIVSRSPAHGVLSATIGRTIWYKPFSNFNGSDELQFTVSDGAYTSSAAKVKITVTAVNDAPVAESQTVTTGLGVPVLVTLSATDVDGTTGMTFRVKKMPAHGTADTTAIKSKKITYTPAALFKGLDTIQYVAYDGTSESAIARIVIGVALENQPPVADPKEYTGVEDENVEVVLTGHDVEMSPLSFIIDDMPKKGLLAGSGATRTYIPNPEFNGVDSFYYHVNDGLLNSSKVKGKITITPVNDRPVARDTTITGIMEDDSLSFGLPFDDVDGDPLTVAFVLAPVHGIVKKVTGTTFRYVPDADYSGTDVFTYTVSDGSLSSKTATASLVVTPVNDAPVAVPQSSVAVLEDGVVTITLNGTDVDNVATDLVYAKGGDPLHGTVTLAGNSAVYTPAENYFGADSFTFTVSDGFLASLPATVGLVIDPLNDIPSISAITDVSVTAGETNGPVVFTVGDEDGDVLTVTASSSDEDVATVVVSGTGAARTYSVSGVAVGSALITITVHDGTASATETFTVTVAAAPVNHSPTISAISDVSVTVGETNGPVPFTVGDEDGDLLTVTAESDNAAVTVTVGGTGATRSYTVVGESAGTATITITADDGTATSTAVTTETFTVTVNAVPVNTAPTISSIADFSITVGETDGPNEFTVGDADGDLLTVTAESDNAAVTVTVGGMGATRSYTVVGESAGTATITITADDGTATSTAVTTETFTVTVNAVNTAPTISSIADFSITVGETDGPNEFTVGDADGDLLTVTAESDNAAVTVTVGGTGATRSYTVVGESAGTATITITADDGTATSTAVTTETFTVTVNAVNTAPTISSIADFSITVGETDGPNEFTVGDADGDLLTVTAESDNAAVTVTVGGTGATRSYTVVGESAGTATITITADDGTATSTAVTTETFTVTVNAVNTAPTISSIADFSITVGETDGPNEFTVGDADGDLLTVTAESDNAAVTVTVGGTGATRSYTVVGESAGTATITITADDGTATSTAVTTETFTVTVNAVVNQPPVATPVAESISEGESAIITLSGTDPESGPLTFSELSGTPSYGTLTSTSETDYEYTADSPVTFPEGETSVTETFTYTVTDDKSLSSSPATVTITINKTTTP